MRDRWRHLLIYVVLTLGALTMILPYYWMVITSLKPLSEIQTYPPTFWVQLPTLQPYRDLFRLLPMARSFLNSLFVAGTVTLANLFFCSLAGYAFAKHRFWGRELIFWTMVCSMMIPWQVNLIPGFVIVKSLGWINTFYALIVPNLATTFGIFLCRQYITSIPDDLIDAAKIDGCGEFTIYRAMILPLIGPVLATLAIFTFLAQWNSFIWPLIVVQTSPMRTVPLVLAALNGQFGANFAMVMAGAVVVTLPVLVVFLFFQRYLIRGITMTGLKG